MLIKDAIKLRYKKGVYGVELVGNGNFTNGNTGWTVNSGTWTFNNLTATLTTNTVNQQVEKYINVLPNKTYLFKGYKSAGTFIIEEWTVSAYIRNYYGADGGGTIITTSPTCTRLRIRIGNTTDTSTGIFIFDDISIRQLL